MTGVQTCAPLPISVVAAVDDVFAGVGVLDPDFLGPAPMPVKPWGYATAANTENRGVISARGRRRLAVNWAKGT